jgi:hypothetical protein
MPPPSFFRRGSPQVKFLNDLTIDASAAYTNVGAGATLANIIGTTAGASRTLVSPSDGTMVLNAGGTQVLAGVSTPTPGGDPIVLTETAAGYANSPHTSPSLPFKWLAPFTIPDVGPGAGGTPPADPTRSGTPKPAAHWFQPDQMVLFQDTVVGLSAYAGGALPAATGYPATSGILRVDFWCEGNVQSVYAEGVYVDTDASGNTRKRTGYWIKLKYSLFSSFLNGTARLFAKIYPSDTTMQPRVIGYGLTDGAGSIINDWPQNFLVRSAESDFDKTIGGIGSGANYTPASGSGNPIADFFNDARTASAKRPKATIITSGNYEAADGNSGTTGTGSAEGRAVLTVASGITATIRRASALNLNDTSNLGGCPQSWRWRPGWPGIEFRSGPGGGLLKFDIQNWPGGFAINGQNWFNGVYQTNSNTNWMFYQNGSKPCPFNVYSDGGVPQKSYHTDGRREFTEQCVAQDLLVSGVKMNSCINSPMDQNNFVVGTYVANQISNWYMNPSSTGANGEKIGNPAITIVGPANATLSVDYVSSFPGVMTLKVGASTIATITIGAIPSDNPTKPVYPSDLAAIINALGGGWSATVPSTGNGPLQGMRFFSGFYNNGAAFFVSGTAYDCSSTATGGPGILLSLCQDVHTEWWHGYSGSGGVRENVILRDNISRNSIYSSNCILQETNLNDALIANNVFECIGDNAGDSGQGGVGGGSQSHVVITNNVFDGGIQNMYTSSGTVDNYCMFSQNMTGWYETYMASWNLALRSTDNLYEAGNNGTPPPSGTYDSGNTSNGTYRADPAGLFQLAFTNKGAGNFLPTGYPAAHLKPALIAFDGLGIARSASDAPWPWSINAVSGDVPLYPF